MNIFTGEATTKFPRATQMARGGVSLFETISFVKILHIIFSLNSYVITKMVWYFFIVIDLSRCNGTWKDSYDNCADSQ